MNRAWGIVLIISVASASFPAVAATPLTHPPSAKRLLIACMTKEMSTSKTMSYNEATRVCKATLKTQSATLASGTVKPMS